MENEKNTSNSTFSSSFTLQNDTCNETDENFLVFKNYILDKHMSDIVRILLEEEVNVHYSLKVDGCDLLENCVALTDILFFQSDKLLKTFNLALNVATYVVYSGHYLKAHMTMKPYLHVRFMKLPSCSEIWRDRVPKSKDIGCFLAIEGTIIRTSSAKILEYKKEYMCMKCKNVFSLQADFQLHYAVPTPVSCPANMDCSGKKFVVMAGNDGSAGPNKCKDYQEMRVQEQVRKLSMGTIPRSITVVLEDDLVDSCKPGDDVVIFGAVTCRWHTPVAGKPCDLEIVIKANNVEVCNDRQSSVKGLDFDELQDEFHCFWAAYGDSPMKARNHILASLCPQVYGLYVVKLAVALVLAGGVPRTDTTGSRVRGECHLLLVGDPGTGKSQFLKYAAKVTPRSVLTTGIGSSSAGLTVSAIRDGPHWTLEAGALVLADGGICCIDEFSGIKEHDQSGIHEAMEQQTISVAKAGLVCKLNTRTSILAATNSKLGKYDESSSVSVNIAMASPLLSRFDLVLVLLDMKNAHWDSVVADYLLMGQDADKEAKQKESNLWSLDQMQTYFGIIRQLTPTLSSEADQVLRAYYRCHRQSNSRHVARTTIRLLESLIRLSEAHARLMFRNIVTTQDAIAAITVVESSMQGGSLLPTGSILHSCFPNDADVEYLKHSRLVLQRLSLEHLLNNNDSVATSPLPVPSVKAASKSLNQDQNQYAFKKFVPDVGTLEKIELNKNILEQSEKENKLLSDDFDIDFNLDDFDSLGTNSIFHVKSCGSKKGDPISHSTPSNINHGETEPSSFILKDSVSRNVSPSKKLNTCKNKEFKLDACIKTPLKSDMQSINSLSNSVSSEHIPTALSPAVTTCLSPLVAGVAQSQVSLFSCGSVHSTSGSQNVSVVSQRKCQLKLDAVNSLNDNTKQSQVSPNNFLNVAKSSVACKPSTIFQLPDSEAEYIFSNNVEFPSSTLTGSDSNNPKFLFGNKLKTANTSFAFTLDPSVVEDMCGDLDFS